MQSFHRTLRRESYQEARPYSRPVDAREPSDHESSLKRAPLQLYLSGWSLDSLAKLRGVPTVQIFRLLFHQIRDLCRQHAAGATMAKLTRQSGLLPAEVRAIVGS